MEGATVSVQTTGSATFSGNGADGGGSDSESGSGYGADIFLGGDVSFQVTAGQTLALNSLGGAGNTADSNVTDHANDPNAQGGITVNGGGRLLLSGTSYYTGQTIVGSGTLELAAGATEQGTSNVVIGAGSGDSAALIFQAGATLNMPSGSNTITLGQGAGSTGTLVVGSGGGAGATLGVAEVTSGSGSGMVIFEQTLAASGSSANYIFAPLISGNIALTQSGSGTTTLTADHTYTGVTTVTDGNLVVDGSIEFSALTTVSDHGILSGSGRVSDVVLADGARISPGNSPGTLTSGGQTWEGGAGYIWEINSAEGAEGEAIGWDWLEIDGTLLILSTSEDRFVIDVTSLTSSDTPGALSDLTIGETYTWTIATALGGISGFSADRFRIDTDAFSTEPGIHGGFTIGTNGNNLVLTYTAVPEPAAVGLILLSAPILAWRFRSRWRRRL